MSLGWVGVYTSELPVNLMHKADRALYHAKSSGCDRVVSYEAEFGVSEERAAPMAVEVFD